MSKSERSYFVYIMTNKWNTTLYIGVTNDLHRRVYEHKQFIYPNGFTARYHLTKLVYYEETNDIAAAIWREKQLKNWQRGWKLILIRKRNPNLEDLSKEIWLDGDAGSSPA